MKTAVCSLILVAVFAGELQANAASNKSSGKGHSTCLVVVEPSKLPELAQKDGEALLLHETGDGRTILYVEGIGGKNLIALDVTDPATVRPIATMALSESGPFDVVQNLNADSILIRYRGEANNYALLNVRKINHPTIALLPTNAYSGSPENIEVIGQSELLFKFASYAPQQSTPMPEDYAVLDTSDLSNPILLTTVHGVKQHISNNQTGTVFLLSSEGITMVRRPSAEQTEVNYN
ncbi:hypothetical protein JAO29_14510 [Edaphobacter sp. HDX4]|uniref:hypothetical protein n=1 Tax=Edaphobacter sp. HDX4 TaxID=2794064 RepID=UPI002FE53907